MPNSETIAARNTTGWKQSQQNFDVYESGIISTLGRKFVYHVNVTTGSRDIYEYGLLGNKLVMNVSADGRVTKGERYQELSERGGSSFITNLKANSGAKSKEVISAKSTPETKQKLQQTSEYGGINNRAAETGPQEQKSGQESAGDSAESRPLTQEEINKLSNIGQRKKVNYPPILKYPEKLSGDHIRIQLIEYKKSGLQSPEGGFGLIQQEKRETSLLSTILLPIQSGISDASSVDWGQGEINPLTAQFAGLAYGTIASGANGVGESIKTFGAGLQDIAGKFLAKENSPEIRQLIVNYFTQQAMQGQVQNLLSRTSGAAINNNVELLFAGPQLRSFTFTFRLTPRNTTESASIKSIIRLFKREMQPEITPSQLFLLAPNIFKIKYIKSGGEDHPFLNRIKKCALKDFSVNYTPDGQYMTYNTDASMTSYEMNLTFAEIDPIYSNDYDEGEGKTGMGY
jgi:hypothetical protein